MDRNISVYFKGIQRGGQLASFPKDRVQISDHIISCFDHSTLFLLHIPKRLHQSQPGTRITYSYVTSKLQRSYRFIIYVLHLGKAHYIRGSDPSIDKIWVMDEEGIL
jgi:hypothetical protein